MKKLKLNLERLHNAQVLTREQLKMILGGDGSDDDDDPNGGGGGCTSNSDCKSEQKCVILPGQAKGGCTTVARGTTCITSSDCGNGQSCVTHPPASGKWCN